VAVAGRKFVFYFVYSLCHVSIFGFFYTGWVFFSFLFNCQVGMLHVHFTDPKLYILLYVLSCFIINYLLHFFYAHLILLQHFIPPAKPRVSLNSCCICLLEENGTSYKYRFINTSYKRVRGYKICHYSTSA